MYDARPEVVSSEGKDDEIRVRLWKWDDASGASKKELAAHWWCGNRDHDPEDAFLDVWVDEVLSDRVRQFGREHRAGPLTMRCCRADYKTKGGLKNEVRFTRRFRNALLHFDLSLLPPDRFPGLHPLLEVLFLERSDDE